MFRLLKSVLGSLDFWVMCFLNMMLTLLVNSIFDFFTVKNAWKTPPRVFNAANLDSIITFFVINAMLMGANRQRQIDLIKEGVIAAVPASAYRNVLSNIFFFGACVTKPFVRAFLITVNAILILAPTYYFSKQIMVNYGIWNKYTIFSGVQSYGPCISCAVFTEMLWKACIFCVLYFLTYMASLNASQPELVVGSDAKKEQ